MRMDAKQIQRRLARIVARTEGAQNVKVPGWWGENNADERRVIDDLKAGRLAWREAHRTAIWGLEALDRGDREKAEACLWISLDHYVNALESRMEPADIEFLSNSAQPRGRRPAKKIAERK